MTPDTFGTPTQVVHPWRAIIRTIFQALAGMATMGIIWLAGRSIGVDLSEYGDAMRESIAYGLWIVATGFYTWLMTRPRVNEVVERLAPFLATGVHTEAQGVKVGDRPNDADRTLDAVGLPAATDDDGDGGVVSDPVVVDIG
ncbi:hypothetical protein QP858_06600 [Trueperella bernardiae]|uniref:Uncharacterized protein n=1 Tax=Trueperella bernardiae TaxID=59561 RepID=A0AAW6ZMC8_9ACTO|nr:hypothetical protein [Trueperella bernardiae]MDK8602122.1 hypothetical protein [Trueperella bernardiae]